jgi:transcriptional regulator with XRE-family HTH domain
MGSRGFSVQSREKENALIAQRIRDLRRSLGLYQEPFAEKLGLDQTTVSKWEKGKARPTPDALVRLASLAEGVDKLFFLGHAGLPKEYFEGAKMIPEIEAASARTVARAFNEDRSRPAPGKASSNHPLDPELLAFVIERVNLELEKRKKKLPHAKYAEMIVLVYEFCLQTGRRDLEMVSRMLKIA